MQYTTQASNEFVALQFTAPTVVEPGDKISAILRLNFIQDLNFQYSAFEFPDSLNLEEIEGLDKPRNFKSGDQLETRVVFLSDKYTEDFGLIKVVLAFQSGQEKVVLTKEVWISVFKKAKANEQELSMDLRKRLIDVVNFRPRNGHIFLADYNAFFEHFLNIIVPDSVKEFLAEEFGLPNEGLPVDPETYYLIIGGGTSFYGIDQLELIAEEGCEESDSRFDPTEVREVNLEEF